MASDLKGTAVVIMGVSGAGKSTIGEMLAKAKECRFLDADDFHPESNKGKMKKGIPLSDEDRIPWLEMLRDALSASLASGKSVILGCSALKHRYREILRSADPNYKPRRAYDDGDGDGAAAASSSVSTSSSSSSSSTLSCVVKFVLLEVGEEVLVARLEERAANGKHFMPVKLLQSQLDLLQIDESEGIFKVDASQSPQAIVNTIIQQPLIF